MAEQTLHFEAEVSRLLHIVANALYSDKRVFLRELISNASDACDRLRHLALTEPALLGKDGAFRIRITVDRAAGTVTVSDNGIGMSRDDLVRELGTIARSGTAAFVEQLSGDAGQDLALIGQFGVGFYASFMVAERVAVVTRKAGEEAAWRWVSDGKGSYTVSDAEKDERGTDVVVHLADDQSEFLDPANLRRIVRTYSDHIGFPILLVVDGKEERVNEGSALWTRPKSEVTSRQYAEFYRHVGHALDEPLLTLHWRAEGTMEYTALLFVPSQRPFDLFDPARSSRVKLYVKRVFITDRCDELVPPWLRFLRGLVDSEDLPLNVSRELLQTSPMVRRIRSGIVKRVLAELADAAEKQPETYARFWEAFGAVLKEGLYEEPEQRDEILKLARFRSTAGEGPASLAEYVARKREGQSAIYYITGDDPAALRKSPQLEGFRARGVEVLLLTDPVDEFWIAEIGEHDGLPFRSATRAGAELGAIAPADEGEEAKTEPAAEAGRLDALIATFKLALGDEVKDVRRSERLTDSAVCLVADEGDVDIRLERLLKQHHRVEGHIKRILEINPGHPLIRSLADALAGAGNGHGAAVEEAARLLLDQARIQEGETLPDPAAFARRLADALARGLGTG